MSQQELSSRSFTDAYKAKYQSKGKGKGGVNETKADTGKLCR